MKIISYFSDVGSPATGLTPTLDVWKLDSTQVVTAQTMIEVAGGFYYYDYTGYDDDEDYVIRADGGNTLANTDRYVYSSNDIGSIKTDSENLLKVQKNKWAILNNQMIIYEDDGTTALFTFDLKDKSGTSSEVEVFSRTPT